MKKYTSISGGQTSAYLAVAFPTEYNVFALVTTDDKLLQFPDPGIRKIVSDRIGMEFNGTLEDDVIIHTLLDLEQFMGRSIDWVAGLSFEDTLRTGGYLPNKLHRYCTTEMKLKPMFQWWYKKINEPVEVQIGFRANEQRRAKNMLDKCNQNGLLEIKATVSKHKNGRNKWQTFEWQRPVFPLIENAIFKDEIVNFWKDKPVRFAKFNNCIGCFHRNEILLKKMSEWYPEKYDWFVRQEQGRKPKDTWRQSGHITYEKIRNHKLQVEIFDTDFDECDSGYCGL